MTYLIGATVLKTDCIAVRLYRPYRLCMSVKMKLQVTYDSASQFSATGQLGVQSLDLRFQNASKLVV